MKAIAILFILILIASVNAAEFSVVLSPTTQDVCPSYHKSYQLTVRNDQSERSIYNIVVSDNVRNWTTITPSTIGLDAGESGITTLFIQPYYTAKPEQIEFSVTTASLNKTIPVKGNLNILNCRGVELTSPTISSCDSQLAPSVITVKNTGISKDSYVLSSDKSWVSFENKSVNVEPGESQKVAMMFTNPPIGSETIKVNAQSVSNYAKTSLDVRFDLGKCFDLNIASDSIEMCPGESRNIDLRIENTGTEKDSLLIYTRDAIIKMDNSTFDLDAGENKTVSAIVDLARTVKSDQTIVFEIGGSVSKTYKQNIKVTPFENCYSLKTSLEKNILTVNKSENIAMKLNIKNEGKIAMNLNVTSDTLWVDLSLNNITLKNEQEKDIFVYVAPSYEVGDGTYIAIINISNEFITKNETIRINVNHDGTDMHENEEQNQTGPILDTERIKKPLEEFMKFVFSPILKLFGKL